MTTITMPKGKPEAGTVFFVYRAALADREQAPGWLDTTRFLTDVVTAAGLLAHGKRDKGLAKRIGEFAFRFRLLAAAPAPADHFRDATKKFDSDAADERAAFEAWLGIKPCGAAHDFGWAAWQARAEKAASNEADAARYRFVKDYDNPDNPIAICRFEESGWDGQWVIEHDPDAVIDAAMAREDKA